MGFYNILPCVNDFDSRAARAPTQPSPKPPRVKSSAAADLRVFGGKVGGQFNPDKVTALKSQERACPADRRLTGRGHWTVSPGGL